VSIHRFHLQPHEAGRTVALIVAASVVWLPATGAAADDGADCDADMPAFETEVRGYVLKPTDESTSFGETIDVTEEARGSSSVGEVLSEAAGVQVRRTGGPGSPAAASIRGSTASQVPVDLDGVLLNAGGFPTVDLGTLSLDTLAEVEIYRGGAPLGVGRAGIGGAVMLHSRVVEEPLSEIALTAGSWSTARLALLQMERIGELGFLGVLSAEGTRGDFLYLNRNGTLHNPDDDRVERRANNASLAYGTLFKLDGPLSGAWRFTAANELHQQRRGVPGIDSVPTENASLRSFREAASLRAGGPLGSDALRLDLDASWLLLRDDFDDTRNEIGIGYQRARSRADTVGGGALLAVEPNCRHHTHVRLEGFHERFATRELVLGEAPDPARRERFGLGLEHIWSPVERLSVVPAVRLDLHRSEFGGGDLSGDFLEAEPADNTAFFWSPSLGARFEIADGLFVRANGGRYLRAPDLAELYGDRGTVVGNPGLEPEVGWNADAGLTWIRSGGSDGLTLLRLDAAWFGSWAQDLIAWVQNSQHTIRPENVDAARILGLETGLRLVVFDLVSLQGNYTYLNAINRSDKPYHDGRRLPGRPAHEAYGKLAVGRVFERWGGALWLDADYAGNVYLDQANLKDDTVGRLLFGVGYRLERPREGLTLTLEVKNIFDTIAVEDADGRDRPVRDYEAYPLPGRTILVTLHLRI
jgi:iron complex outermembrane receptor protein